MAGSERWLSEPASPGEPTAELVRVDHGSCGRVRMGDGGRRIPPSSGFPGVFPSSRRASGGEPEENVHEAETVSRRCGDGRQFRHVKAWCPGHGVMPL